MDHIAYTTLKIEILFPILTFLGGHFDKFQTLKNDFVDFLELFVSFLSCYCTTPVKNQYNYLNFTFSEKIMWF